MKPDEILQELQARGLSYSAIAELLGVGRSHVRKVVHREDFSRRVALAVAAAIELTVGEVFPDVPKYTKPTPAERRRSSTEALRRRYEAAGLVAASA